MAKKAKWLEEATLKGLLEIVEEVLGGDLENKEVNRAKKAIAEAIERLPEEGEVFSVEDALANLEANFTEGLVLVQEAYKSELEAIGDDEDYEDEDVEDDESEEDEEEEGSDYDEMSVKDLKAECRERGIKVKKGMGKDDLIEALIESDDESEDEEDDEDEDEVDYSEYSQKDLKDMCRERGIKVTKGMKKADFIKALEADDEE